MPNPTEIVQQFALRNGLAFSDPALLRTALTHRSYLNEHADLDWEDNERLEYLGDAVLDFVLAEYLYRGFPAAPEGELTALRAALVRRETLARLAQRLDIGPALFMGHGEVETGGRERTPNLCGAFEAVVGALYLDQGLQSVTEWVMPLMEVELTGAHAEVADKDPKSRLQELAQSKLGITPRYRTVERRRSRPRQDLHGRGRARRDGQRPRRRAQQADRRPTCGARCAGAGGRMAAQQDTSGLTPKRHHTR